MEPTGFDFAVSLYQSLSGAGLRTFLWGESMLEDYIEAKRLGDWAYPVSYTHLTLPTKLDV